MPEQPQCAAEGLENSWRAADLQSKHEAQRSWVLTSKERSSRNSNDRVARQQDKKAKKVFPLDVLSGLPLEDVAQM